MLIVSFSGLFSYFTHAHHLHNATPLAWYQRSSLYCSQVSASNQFFHHSKAQTRFSKVAWTLAQQAKIIPASVVSEAPHLLVIAEDATDNRQVRLVNCTRLYISSPIIS